MRFASLLVAGIIFGWFVGQCIGAQIASADHNVYLPISPNTPLMQQAINVGIVQYCLNEKAEAYPQFAAQVEDVNKAYTDDVGIRFVKVAWTNPDCQVQHNMLHFECGGCAAHIFYASSLPVVIEYKYTLGFTDWRSAIGHELGHGLLGLHERYIDRGSIRCGGPEQGETEMDCGWPYIKYPQALDIERACALVDDAFTACTPVPPETTWPQWNGYHWAFGDTDESTAYVPSTGRWERLINDTWVEEFSECRTHEQAPYRQNLILSGAFLRPGSTIWDGRWAITPSCPTVPSSASVPGAGPS